MRYLNLRVTTRINGEDHLIGHVSGNSIAEIKRNVKMNKQFIHNGIVTIMFCDDTPDIKMNSNKFQSSFIFINIFGIIK